MQRRTAPTGLVALGDSITRAGGAADAAYRSWAAWLADALGLALTNLAADGAQSHDVLARQIPRLRGPYELAAVYVGVNDARSPDWHPPAFADDVAAILDAVALRAQRMLVLTLPHDLGRPTAAPKPAVAGEILRDAAARSGAVVAELDSFGGPQLVDADAVHPTPLGQLAIAERAGRALGVSVLARHPPSS